MEISACIWQAQAVTHCPVSSAFEASVGAIHNTSEKTQRIVRQQLSKLKNKVLCS